MQSIPVAKQATTSVNPEPNPKQSVSLPGEANDCSDCVIPTLCYPHLGKWEDPTV